MRFHCPSCDSTCADSWRHYRCATCGGPFEICAEPATFPPQAIAARPATPWRYAEALPPWASSISLGEVMTPLVPFDLAGRQVHAKCEYVLPSSSYKDRGAALMMAHLKRGAIVEAVEDSSGNAGAALAAYAARAGIQLKVFCPASAAPSKLAQIRLYGAEVVPVAGPRAHATAALLDYIRESEAVYASHLWNPLFIAGIKTLAYELAEQLGWRAPDVVACPVGAGSILLGLYAGFTDLLKAGVIAQLPRLVAVQAQSVCPLYRAWIRGDEDVAAVTPEPTIAAGIALPQPVRGRQLITALRQSRGAAVIVTESAIEQGKQQLGRAGFCVEPTAAVVWKGLENYLGECDLGKDAIAVAVLSGHGLKAL